MDRLKSTIITTQDGSHSIHLPELDESYHSRHGALTESIHVFIHAGLHTIEYDPVTVLEVGFGTGLNALLTAIDSKKRQVSVRYHALEPFPVGVEIMRQLNYTEILDADVQVECYEKICRAAWEKEATIHEHFSLKKIKSKIEDYEASAAYDLIYYDAFAPRVQPELWTRDIFAKVHGLLKPEGRMVTYCAKGEVKRNLVGCGFIVEALPGPPGKREMIRAIRLPDRI